MVDSLNLLAHAVVKNTFGLPEVSIRTESGGDRDSHQTQTSFNDGILAIPSPGSTLYA